MTSTFKLLASASALATAALAATPAFAQVTAGGTDAGTEVTNNVTLNYKVGGIDQTEKEADNTFVVDRKIMFLVSNDDGTGEQASVSPGQEEAYQAFTVTNSTNGTIDLKLVVSVQGGEFGQTATDYKIYTDAALTTELTKDGADYYLDQMTEGEDRTVYIVYVPAVPIDSANLDDSAIRLTATPFDGTTASDLGAALTESTGADDPEEVDNVFAEGENKTDAGNTEFDGVDWDEGGFVVATASLTVTKTSKIVSDPVNGTSDPKAIPQAVVEYCISVTNSTDVAATDVVIADELPSQLTYAASTTGIKVGGADCSTPGATEGENSGQTVEGTIATLNGNSTQTMIFRATIN